jgi:hypothetical protein
MFLSTLPCLTDGEKAVITTAIGGILAIVIDRKNGRFVRTNDSIKVANKRLSIKLGRAACLTILNEFIGDSEFDETLAFHSRLELNTLSFRVNFVRYKRGILSFNYR